VAALRSTWERLEDARSTVAREAVVAVALQWAILNRRVVRAGSRDFTIPAAAARLAQSVRRAPLALRPLVGRLARRAAAADHLPQAMPAMVGQAALVLAAAVAGQRKTILATPARVVPVGRAASSLQPTFKLMYYLIQKGRAEPILWDGVARYEPPAGATLLDKLGYAAWMAEQPERVVPVPHEVTRRQLFLAVLSALNLTRSQLRASLTDEASLIDFDEAQTFRRDYPLLLSLAKALGYTTEQIDDLFRLAETL